MKLQLATLYCVVVALAVGSESKAQTPVVIQSAMNLLQPRIGTGQTATVNDFHVRFQVNGWEKSYLGAPLNRNYLNPGGYYYGTEAGALPGATMVAADQSENYIDITWTFPERQISDLNMPWFGFTFGNGQYGVPNGFRYQAVEWYWTKDGERVTQYDETDPDVWQDWIKEWDTIDNCWELRDVIVNRESSPRQVTVTAGLLVNPLTPLTVSDLATGGILPPNPVLPPPNPVLPGGGGTVVTPWPWPGTDPNYYIYYDVANGVTPGASFRNAVVLAPVPEPGTLVLLVAAGLGGLCCVWRRRRSK